MDFAAHVRETARWLATMARMPGELALEHAKHREAELVKDPLYADLPAFVKEELRRMRADSKGTA